jgi:DNA polymerase
MGRYLDIIAAARHQQVADCDKSDQSRANALNGAEILAFWPGGDRDKSRDQSATKGSTVALVGKRWEFCRGDALVRTPVPDFAYPLPVTLATPTPTETVVYLDFETVNRGGCDLKTAGAWRYAPDPATEILMAGYRSANCDEVQSWWPANDCDDKPLIALAVNPAVRFVCFGDFEIAIWDRIMVERHGFPEIPLARWHNAQAACSHFALPRALGKVLSVIGAPVAKDTVGQRLVVGLSRQNRKSGAYPDITPEILERVRGYNGIDVDGLATIHAAVGTLPERERVVWELDQTINRRGIRIDLDFVHASKRIAETAKVPLIAEFGELTGGLSPHQVGKTREWLKGRGFTLENLQAETVADALETMTLPPDVRRVLEIRSITGSTALAKLDAMSACAGADGRARGLFQYHGATTGRWSAQLIQPQNLPRPTVDITPDEIDDVVAAVKTGEVSALDRWGKPIDVLTSALRFAFVAAEGAKFGAGDFSLIEVCMLLALAGEHGKCRLIADGVDVYRDMAAVIYRLDHDAFLALPKDALTVEQAEQRRIGKNTILGCGYAMGAETFRRRYCRHLEAEEARPFAEEVVNTHYRQHWAPKVPKLWRDLEDAARRAMSAPGITTNAQCGISYRLETKAGLSCLVCRLLNGKEIHYMDAKAPPDNYDLFGRRRWTYYANRLGSWREIEPYGGQLTENVVQALARELLVDAMLRFEARGFPIVAHVHDEIIVEHPGITADIVREIMAEAPPWAAELGVPIRVDAWVGSRYRK